MDLEQKKYLDVKYNFIRDIVSQGIAYVKKVQHDN